MWAVWCVQHRKSSQRLHLPADEYRTYLHSCGLRACVRTWLIFTAVCHTPCTYNLHTWEIHCIPIREMVLYGAASAACPAPPRCRLVIAEGGEDVTLKVSDEGGGIPRSGMPNIWTYLYSTAKR